jgi:hypothetical protein
MGIFEILLWSFLCNLKDMLSSGCSGCSASKFIIGVLEGDIQAAGGPMHYPLCRPLYA